MCFAAVFFLFAANTYAEVSEAELTPVAAEILAPKIQVEKYKQSLPPVARYILFELDASKRTEETILASERDEEPVRTESNWDELPEGEIPDDDISDFLRQFQPTENVPKILTPRDGSLLPDRSNIHIRIKYDGTEPVFAEINSIASSSYLEVKDNELVILSSKLVRGREYHLRIKAGHAYSETVSFRVGSKYEDEIARIIANTDIVAVGPRIPMEKIFPNGFFHSEEEADANMVTITVKVWRANTEEVEVDEEEVVDEIVRTIKVPVTKYEGGETEVSEDILLERSVNGSRKTDDEDGEEEISETEEEENESTAEEADETAEIPPEEPDDEQPEPVSETVIHEQTVSQDEVSDDETAEADEPETEDGEEGKLVIEEYTEM